MFVFVFSEEVTSLLFRLAFQASGGSVGGWKWGFLASQALGKCGGSSAGGPLSSQCRVPSVPFVLNSGFSSQFSENGTPHADSGSP